MYTQKMHLFIQATHLNSILSLWISWWANAPRLNTKSSTVNLSWWRDQIKKRQTCTDSSILKKNRGKNSKKKLPETLKRSGSKIDLIWTPGCKSLILLMQISQSQWNIAQDIDLAYDTQGWISENSTYWKFYIELFTEPNGHILKKSQSFQCCGRINISNGSVTASQWPYLYCYRKVRRACITLDGMSLCFYPILSKSWALTKAIVTNRDPGMTKPELNYKPKKTPTIFWISYFKGIYIYIYSWKIYHKEIIKVRTNSSFRLYLSILKSQCFLWKKTSM